MSSLVQTSGLNAQAENAAQPPVPACPLLRSDLLIVRTFEQNGSRFTIKVPGTDQYFQVGEDEHAIMMLINGQNSIAQICEQAGTQFNLDVDRDTVEDVVQLLVRSNCLAGKQEALEADDQSALSQFSWKSILYLKYPLVNPDHFLSWLEPKVRFLFTPGFALFVPAFFLFNLYWLLSDATVLMAEVRAQASITG
ncbi:MAG: hypothetical protein R3194_06935, partial [Limnobacter sp.]|nr:hypothetical protein [Limnobacter sp.]